MKQIALNGKAKRKMAMLSETAKLLWEKGWAEKNGGNMSLNMTGIIRAPLNTNDYQHVISEKYPKDASGMLFYVKRTGERIRDMRKPLKGGCIVLIDKAAKGYYLLWAGEGDGPSRVTSEFISHVYLHLDKVRTGSPHRAVVHTHPIELIAISHHPKYAHDGVLLNRVLSGMLPEVRAHVPRGIALAEYTMPGSSELAALTLKGLKTHDVVIWNKHGATATGRDTMEAFDFIDVANKGAAVLLKCLGSGFEPEGMSDREMRAFEKQFNL
jgi:rhamnulose-1-phosphate aldolase